MIALFQHDGVGIEPPRRVISLVHLPTGRDFTGADGRQLLDVYASHCCGPEAMVLGVVEDNRISETIPLVELEDFVTEKDLQVLKCRSLDPVVLEYGKWVRSNKR